METIDYQLIEKHELSQGVYGHYEFTWGNITAYLIDLETGKELFFQGDSRDKIVYEFCQAIENKVKTEFITHYLSQYFN